MTQSVAQRTNAMPDRISSRELYRLLLGVQADLAALKTSLNQLITDYDAATKPTTAAAVTLNTTP